MPEISEKVMELVADKMGVHLKNYRKEIDAAFNEEDVEKLTVTCKATFDTTTKGAGLKVTTGIKFKPNKDIEDGESFYYDDKQMELFPDSQ